MLWEVKRQPKMIRFQAACSIAALHTTERFSRNDSCRYSFKRANHAESKMAHRKALEKTQKDEKQI
jgi:hypothetical protein